MQTRLDINDYVDHPFLKSVMFLLTVVALYVIRQSWNKVEICTCIVYYFFDQVYQIIQFTFGVRWSMHVNKFL